jgi:hypothetical protein
MARRWLIAGAALMMISCDGSQRVGVGSPKDCAEAMRHDFQCTGRFPAKDERLMLLSCFPFSEPKRINGAWVTGFEANEFYEGEQTSGARTHKGISDTQLVISIPSQPGPFMQFYQLEFVGRRSLCDMGFPRHIIVVDRIISAREDETH